ncbi:uncharacterized protein F13E9.13, mitochondrial-like isoform X1 [Ruditapes philippinarum]|uniref:uncharacterized protein F13E9.13, mitochondrial-like isoform X1 n=1 Tax=Ruditapes philippinarum TaxID=129788 RepID=UPI00295B1EB9|nr:uncharacterized protein F13E9.13, mitochondrial-like isoform X1 [Ruditapes philippinarum]
MLTFLSTCHRFFWILKNKKGTPRYQGSVRKIIEKAEYEAKIYKEAGVDSVLVENMHDIPYLHTQEVGPEVVSTMTRACSRVRQVFDTGPVGVQILAGANKQGLAVAVAAELDYIRAEGFVFSHVADEGLMNACAGPLLRYRKMIGAEHIQVFTDIKKKHSAHSITSDVSIEDTAQAAQYFLTDGVILTGSSTGLPVNHQELEVVQKSVDIPVLIGSGVTADNYPVFKSAHALIIGSYFKMAHRWHGDIDEKILSDFMDIVRKDRSSENIQEEK